MDKIRKREIIENADFSEGKIGSDGKSGFGQLVAGLKAVADILTSSRLEDSQRKEWLQRLTCEHDTLITYYDSIPFEEMDRSDPDFPFLFNCRDKIEEIGIKLESYVDKCLANSLKGSREWSEFTELNSVIMELWNMMHHFRDTILKNLDQPIPNQ